MFEKPPYCVIFNSIEIYKQEIYWLPDKPDDLTIKSLVISYLHKYEKSLVNQVLKIQIKEPSSTNWRKEILVFLRHATMHIQFIEGFPQLDFPCMEEMLTHENAYIRKIAKMKLEE